MDDADAPAAGMPKVTRRVRAVIRGSLPQSALVLINNRAVPGHPCIMLPGGGVEEGEGPLQALQRELAEELGITAELNAGNTRFITARAYEFDVPETGEGHRGARFLPGGPPRGGPPEHGAGQGHRRRLHDAERDPPPHAGRRHELAHPAGRDGRPGGGPRPGEEPRGARRRRPGDRQGRRPPGPPQAPEADGRGRSGRPGGDAGRGGPVAWLDSVKASIVREAKPSRDPKSTRTSNEYPKRHGWD